MEIITTMDKIKELKKQGYISGVKLGDKIREAVRIYKLIHNYKPWKRALKDIESSVGRKGEMVPCCPKCHEPFELSEITNYVNRKYVRED